MQYHYYYYHMLFPGMSYSCTWKRFEPEPPVKLCSVPPDLTFLHESCKTFHGDLVNFEKMVSQNGGRLQVAAASLVLERVLQAFNQQNLEAVNLQVLVVL